MSKENWGCKGCHKKLTSSSSSSGKELSNIQSATRGLLTSPISRAASNTDARKAFDSLAGPPEALLAGAGRITGACGRGNVKLAFMVGSKALERDTNNPDSFKAKSMKRPVQADFGSGRNQKRDKGRTLVMSKEWEVLRDFQAYQCHGLRGDGRY
jgi:hypothetical protein